MASLSIPATRETIEWKGVYKYLSNTFMDLSTLKKKASPTLVSGIKMALSSHKSNISSTDKSEKLSAKMEDE